MFSLSSLLISIYCLYVVSFCFPFSRSVSVLSFVCYCNNGYVIISNRFLIHYSTGQWSTGMKNMWPSKNNVDLQFLHCHQQHFEACSICLLKVASELKSFSSVKILKPPLLMLCNAHVIKFNRSDRSELYGFNVSSRFYLIKALVIFDLVQKYLKKF